MVLLWDVFSENVCKELYSGRGAIAKTMSMRRRCKVEVGIFHWWKQALNLCLRNVSEWGGGQGPVPPVGGHHSGIESRSWCKSVGETDLMSMERRNSLECRGTGTCIKMQGAESIKLKGYNQSVPVGPLVQLCCLGKLSQGCKSSEGTGLSGFYYRKPLQCNHTSDHFYQHCMFLWSLKWTKSGKEMYFFPLWPTNPPVFCCFFFLSILELVLNNWNWNHDEKWDCIILRTKLFVSEWRGEGGDLRRVSCYAGF